jgi:hypothetical protein
MSPQLLGYTPLYVAKAAGAKRAAKVLEDAGGLYTIPPTATPGYRTVLDAPIKRNMVCAVDDKARQLGRRPYVGQF